MAYGGGVDGFHQWVHCALNSEFPLIDMKMNETMCLTFRWVPSFKGSMTSPTEKRQAEVCHKCHVWDRLCFILLFRVARLRNFASHCLCLCPSPIVDIPPSFYQSALGTFVS